jgi:hypothetical protein
MKTVYSIEEGNIPDELIDLFGLGVGSESESETESDD